MSSGRPREVERIGNPLIMYVRQAEPVRWTNQNLKVMGRTSSVVQVEVNGKMQEIPVDQIVSIEVGPPAQ